jgi:hypothetical protein
VLSSLTSAVFRRSACDELSVVCRFDDGDVMIDDVANDVAKLRQWTWTVDNVCSMWMKNGMWEYFFRWIDLSMTDCEMSDDSSALIVAYS